MKKTVGFLVASLFMALFLGVAYAKNPYPETLDDGNLVLVDAHMGVANYADLSSAEVYEYAPPDYQIAIHVVRIMFSDDYYRQHKTYIDGPYTVSKPGSMLFRYNWDDKSISVYSKRQETWKKWDINRDNTHADGEPFIPCTAEAAFAAAYGIRFFDDTEGYSPVLRRTRRVIPESFYERMGI